VIRVVLVEEATAWIDFDAVVIDGPSRIGVPLGDDVVDFSVGVLSILLARASADTGDQNGPDREHLLPKVTHVSGLLDESLLDGSTSDDRDEKVGLAGESRTPFMHRGLEQRRNLWPADIIVVADRTKGAAESAAFIAGFQAHDLPDDRFRQSPRSRMIPVPERFLVTAVIAESPPLSVRKIFDDPSAGLLDSRLPVPSSRRKP
jgi:hypothetical protein